MPGDRYYTTPRWRDLRRLVLTRDGYRCTVPGCVAIANRVDHIVSRRQGGADAPHNLRSLCAAHDNEIKERADGTRAQGGRFIKGANLDGTPSDDQHPWNSDIIASAKIEERARPKFAKPKCRVMLICGPPASGKSTYVLRHAGAGDIIIDLDAIAHEFGIGRDRTSDQTSILLDERNRRLRQLANTEPDQVAWIILTAASESLRVWWQKQLGAETVIVLEPTREELRRRVLADPTRRNVQDFHLRLIDQWFRRERADSPGYVSGRSGADGRPWDPLHHWNRQ